MNLNTERMGSVLSFLEKLGGGPCATALGSGQTVRTSEERGLGCPTGSKSRTPMHRLRPVTLL